MPLYLRNGEVYEATRYQPGRPGRPGHIIHRLSELGVPCVHLRPITQAIAILDSDEMIAIQDPRHHFGNAEAIIYPGDWIAWRHPLKLEIVPNLVFEQRYRDAD